MTMDPPETGPTMEARGIEESHVVELPREPDPDLDEESRVYGSRWVEVESDDGRTSFREVPLTWEDLFDPQVGDHVPHGPIHNRVISETKESLVPFFASKGRDDVVVYDDVKMFWRDPKIPTVGPDLAVIPGMEQPKDPKRESFDEREEGTRPVFVLEVTSKATAPFDRKDKPKIYRRAGVRECFLLERLTSPWGIVARRLNPRTGRYRKVAPDDRGRYLAETIGVCFSISESGDELVLEDAATGEVILKPLEQAEARREAERRAAEAARARGEETRAREAAERRAAREAEARAAAEAEVRELQAEIERLRSSGD